MNEISPRSLTIAYSLALSIVAALSFLSHVTINNILHEREGSAGIINISGQQRMLAQRVTAMAAEYALGDTGAQKELIAAAAQLESNHRALAHGDAALGIPAPSSAALVALYSAGGTLETNIVDFLARARKIADLPSDDRRAREELRPALNNGLTPILSDLDSVVRFHQGASESQLQKLERLQNISLIVVLATLLAEAMGIFRPMVSRIHRYTTELLRMANRDPLTAVLNRKGFADHALTELVRAQRYRRPTSFVMMDADYFKSINDRFGHAGGDAALKAIAAAVSSCLRPADIFGRLGGEEFGILLPETTIVGASAAAERVRRHIESLSIPTQFGAVSCTVSLGVTEIRLGEADLDEAMIRADAALYRAKAQGRNCVMTEDLPPPARTAWRADAVAVDAAE